MKSVPSNAIVVLALAVPAALAAWIVSSPGADDRGAVEAGSGSSPAILGARPFEPAWPVSVVRHRWQVKIARSNHVAIRPGSVYDIVTYFELNLGMPRPLFNYLMVDTGLGTADPIYPLFQHGQQGSWAQLLPAMWSDRNRHIDHESMLDSPEGCRIYATYGVRHIDEFPSLYARERTDGYSLVDISFNYYEKRRPDAQCGRHHANDPDPGFDPLSAIRPYAEGFTGYDSIPPELLSRYETKIGLLKLVSETFDSDRWPRFADQYRFKKNSLWYHPDGARPVHAAAVRRGDGHAPEAGRFLFEHTPALAARFPLNAMLPDRLFTRYLDFLDGRPAPGFDPAREPGGDAVGLDDIRPTNYFTSGLDIIPIGSPDDVRKLVRDPANYRLVSIIVRPYQSEADRPVETARIVPQIRFVYQLHRPASDGAGAARPLEQLFLHLNYDVTDPDAPRPLRDLTHRQLLDAVARIAAQRERGDAGWEAAVSELVADRVAPSRLARVSFSSALTGLWVFGSLSRAQGGDDGALEPERVVREGIDVGYYSSTYDTVLFREALARASGPRRTALAAHLAALTPEYYRDPRRSDPGALRFARMTCAQCHHMAGRDAVHVALNDGLDRRFTAQVRYSDFTLHEIARQLAEGVAYWSELDQTAAIGDGRANRTIPEPKALPAD